MSAPKPREKFDQPIEWITTNDAERIFGFAFAREMMTAATMQFTICLVVLILAVSTALTVLTSPDATGDQPAATLLHTITPYFQTILAVAVLYMMYRSVVMYLAHSHMRRTSYRELTQRARVLVDEISTKELRRLIRAILAQERAREGKASGSSPNATSPGAKI